MEKKRDGGQGRASLGRGEDGDDEEAEKVDMETDTSSSSSSSSSWLFAAHPCWLLQYVVRACAGRLLGQCGGSALLPVMVQRA